MTELPYSLERTVIIAARPATVFRYFTDSARFAAWWGAGSRIDPRPGGEVLIRYPNGASASGQVLELTPPERISFTYGYDAPEGPIPPGGSRVSISLTPHRDGTLVTLHHDLPSAAVRDAHQQGWRFQLALFANVVAGEAHQGAESAVDRFLAVWNEPDAAHRRTELGLLAAPELVFHDRFSATAGVDDLVAHIGAAQVHLPGIRLEREGPVQLCQGTAVAQWLMRGPDGTPQGRGTNVFDFDADGRIARVVGLWAGH